MYGKNPVMKPRESGSPYLVRSVFETIQGEGPFTGRRALFIRFGGCNLRCSFCDTDFDQEKSANRTADELANIASSSKASLVVLTGGEPFLQPDLERLLSMLVKTRKEIQFETAGTVSTEEAFEFVMAHDIHVVISPKTKRLGPRWRDLEGVGVDYKYVVSTNMTIVDGLPNHLDRPGPFTPKHRIWIQPMDEGLPALTGENVEMARDLCLTHGFSMSLQTHKIIGVE